MMLKFRNWEKYNQRAKDYKRVSWFSLSNNFMEDQDLFKFTNNEKLCFVFLLCQACKNNKSGLFELDIEHFTYHSKIPNREVLSCIEKLIEKQILEKIRPASGQHPTSIWRNPSVTEHNITEQNRNISSRSFQELEIFYREFPLKKGKAEGMGRLKRQLKTDKDVQDFGLAVRAYREQVLREQTDPKFIMHFSTFVGTPDKPRWRDFLDPDSGQSISTTKAPMSLEDLERIAQGWDNEVANDRN